MPISQISHANTSFSPPVVLDRLRLDSREIFVAREDLLLGGTKQRAICPFLEAQMATGIREFIYASPFCGFAQVALAAGGQATGAKITLFCERDPSIKTPSAHALTRLSQRLGARIVLCEDLLSADRQARISAESHADRLCLPLGFRHPDFMRFYRRALALEIARLAERSDFAPRDLWVPVGSGTLARLFRELFPEEVRISCVDVRVLAPDDERIEGLLKLPNTRILRADEFFHEPCRARPPLPSNPYYDAKLWRFLSAHANHGDLWWNVAA